MAEAVIRHPSRQLQCNRGVERHRTSPRYNSAGVVKHDASPMSGVLPVHKFDTGALDSNPWSSSRLEFSGQEE